MRILLERVGLWHVPRFVLTFKPTLIGHRFLVAVLWHDEAYAHRVERVWHLEHVVAAVWRVGVERRVALAERADASYAHVAAAFRLNVFHDGVAHDVESVVAVEQSLVVADKPYVSEAHL